MGSYKREQELLDQILEEVMRDSECQEIAYDDHSGKDQSDEDEIDYAVKHLDKLPHWVWAEYFWPWPLAWAIEAKESQKFASSAINIGT